MSPLPTNRAPLWTQLAILAAGVCHLAAGGFLAALSGPLLRLAGVDPSTQVGQSLVVILLILGVIFLVASAEPARHWPIALVGLLGNVAVGFASVLALSFNVGLNAGALVLLLASSVLWSAILAAILYQAVKTRSDLSESSRLTFSEAVSTARSHRGATLLGLSDESPTLVVFLRHSGCSFCRQTMSDLAREWRHLDKAGIELAVVHMSHPLSATQFADKYGLGIVHRFSDPKCELYRAFALDRGTFRQLFGLGLWWRFFIVGVLKRHGVGLMAGDGFRMPGAFLMRGGRIVAAHRATTAADQPDYQSLCELELGRASLASAKQPEREALERASA